MNIFHNNMVKMAGRRSGTGNALALVFSYGYNADGLLDSMTRPNGSIVQTTYTARNQVDQILVDGAPPVVDYSYNLRGLMTGKTYESGGLATTISHDAKGQVLAVANSSNFGTLDQLGYGYDSVGQRTYMQRVDGRGDLYGYDKARQVTATKLDIDSPSTGGIGVPANDLSYAYDLGGNRSQTIDGGLATGYTANDVNEYTLVGADVPVYDNNGNLTSGDGRQMAWDAHNRLLSVVPATPVDGDLRAFYRYDGTGRRISKIVDKYDAGLAQWVAEQTRTFGYDGWNMVREGVVDISTGAVETQVKSYTWGVDLSSSPQGAGGVGGLLMVEEDNDPGNPVSPITAYYYTNDANGNVTTVADSAGNPVAQYEYDPYGKLVASAGVYADDNPYRFSTKFVDSESGWSYYGFRYYLPYIGRWINRDPIGERGGVNLYSFVGNGGVNRVDWLGLITNQTKAARNALNKWNPKSISQNVEHCGMVCKHKKTGGHITTETTGTLAGCDPGSAPCPDCYDSVAYWHTHGGFNDSDGDGVDNYDTENFSDIDIDDDGTGDQGDIPYADSQDLDAYLGTPNGDFQHYDHNGGNTYDKGSISTQ